MSIGNRIVIFEGPAGAGKTTCLNRVWADTHAPIIRHPLEASKIRDFENMTPTVFARDIWKWSHALGYLAEHPGSTVLIDRFWLSYWVYDRMIRGTERIGTKFWNYLSDVEDMLLMHRFQLGAMMQQRLELPEIHWVIVQPELPEGLEERRRTAGKDYPFDAFQEWANYGRVYWALRDRKYSQLYHYIDRIRGVEQLSDLGYLGMPRVEPMGSASAVKGTIDVDAVTDPTGLL